jgi:hypothetical protein
VGIPTNQLSGVCEKLGQASRVALLVWLCAVPLAPASAAAEATVLNKLPLIFEPNAGQVDPEIQLAPHLPGV